MNRKGLEKRVIEPNKVKITINKKLKKNQYAFCKALINSTRSINLVSNCTESDLIKECGREETNIKSIDVDVIKIWDSIDY